MSCIWLEGPMFGQKWHFHSPAEFLGAADVPKRQTASIYFVHFTLQYKGAEYETLLSKQWARVWKQVLKRDGDKRKIRKKRTPCKQDLPACTLSLRQNNSYLLPPLKTIPQVLLSLILPTLLSHGEFFGSKY